MQVITLIVLAIVMVVISRLELMLNELRSHITIILLFSPLLIYDHDVLLVLLRILLNIIISVL